MILTESEYKKKKKKEQEEAEKNIKNTILTEEEYFKKTNKERKSKVLSVDDFLVRGTAKNKLEKSTSSKVYQALTEQEYDRGTNSFKVKESTKSSSDNTWFNKNAKGNVLGKTVATAGDIGVNLLKGVAGAGDKLGDLASYLIAGVADVTGNKEYAKTVREGASLDLTGKTIDAGLGKIGEKIDSYSITGDKLDNVFRSVGESYALAKVGTLAPKGGNIPIKLGKTTLNMPTTSILTGFSSSMTDAYNKGATNTQALIKGITGGLSEGFSEGLFGIFGQGGSSIEDVIMSKFTRNIENAISRKIAKIGIQSVGEGLEEAVSYTMNYVSDHAQDIIYDALGIDSEKMSDNWSWEELGESMLSGFIAGGISSTADTVITSTKAKIGDVRAKYRETYEQTQQDVEKTLNRALTETEQETLQGIVQSTVENNREMNTSDIIDELSLNETIKQNLTKEAENNLKEKLAKEMGNDITKEDVTLTKKQLSEINKEVEKMISDGSISTEKLDSFLNNENDTKKYNELKSKLPTQEKYNELKKYIEEYESKKEHTQLEEATYNKNKRIIKEAGEIVNNNKDFLETYENNLNKIRKNQYNPYFKSYLNEYQKTKQLEIETSNNEKINVFRESAKKYNLNNSTETHDMLNIVEKIIGDKNYNILFDDTIVNKEGKSVNAQIKALENGEIEIKLNPNSKRAIEFLLVHEITHAIETESMKKLILEHASKDSEFNQALESLKKTYGTEDVSSEVIADISGQLLGNQEFINNLSIKEPSLFKKIYNKIKELANKITGNSKESAFIKDLKKQWESAYRNTSNEQAVSNVNEGKYHLSKNALKEVNDTINNPNTDIDSMVKLRDYTPEHLVSVGVKDLPMLVRKGHLRENILTSAEAKNKGYSIKGKHYHGLGIDTYMKAIDSLDNPISVYQYTDKGNYSKDNFIVLTEVKDNSNNNIIVPIEIHRKGQYNKVEIDTNRIKTTYGRETINYFNSMVKTGNLIEIYNKKRSAKLPMQSGNLSTSTTNNVPQTNANVNTSSI